ncbi:MAG: hypothetical protein KBB32_12405 [Spirochaetia bacterium]|nr:hypothetical protein [Spirochaetia bacterium]
MGSEAALGQAACALMAVAAALALAAVLALRRAFKWGRRPGLSALFLALSAGAAAAAWACIAVVRAGMGSGALLGWALAGAAVGALVGSFPRAGGAAVLSLVALGLFLGLAETRAWHPWKDGAELAALTVYDAADDHTLCVLSVPRRNAVPVLKDIRLPPGDLAVELAVLNVRGPLAWLSGPRFYRLRSIKAGPATHELPMNRGVVEILDPAWIWLGPALGLAGATLLTDAFAAEDLAAARVLSGADGLPALELD